MANRKTVFVSSVQKELHAERRAVKNFLRNDPLLRRFFDVFLLPERLRETHASIPRNPLIAEPLYLARYIEKAGNGTLDMIERCGEAGLPSPDFEERAGQFVTTIWRDWLTDAVISGLGLNERQMKALAFVKVHARITNKDYRDLTGSTIRTASRDLEELVTKGVLRKIGVTSRGAHYVLAGKQDEKRANRT